MRDIEEIAYKKEMTGQLECPINEDFIWCLEYLSNCEQISDILLIRKDVYGEYEFITQTLNLREHGLPVDFYVVAKSSQYFLCGRGDSPRLYLFSESLGITNTKYESIFDYIIEQLTESD